MRCPDPVCLDSAAQDGCALRVAFCWQADRYAHQLQCTMDGRALPLLISVEGAADERWPPSPPFQQLSVEDRAGGSQVALLVGMAGRSHWSASVQVASDAPQIMFDVACQAREFPRHIGSAYRAELPPCPADAGQLALSLPNGRLARLGIETLPDEPAGQLLADGHQIAVSRPCTAKSLPVTIRWKYTVEMVVSAS